MSGRDSSGGQARSSKSQFWPLCTVKCPFLYRWNLRGNNILEWRGIFKSFLVASLDTLNSNAGLWKRYIHVIATSRRLKTLMLQCVFCTTVPLHWMVTFLILLFLDIMWHCLFPTWKKEHHLTGKQYRTDTRCYSSSWFCVWVFRSCSRTPSLVHYLTHKELT